MECLRSATTVTPLPLLTIYPRVDIPDPETGATRCTVIGHNGADVLVMASESQQPPVGESHKQFEPRGPSWVFCSPAITEGWMEIVVDPPNGPSLDLYCTTLGKSADFQPTKSSRPRNTLRARSKASQGRSMT